MNLINEMSAGKCLIISNPCGGGHVQAATRVNQLITQRNLDAENKVTAVTKDILIDVLGHLFGSYIAEDWSNNQKNENIHVLNRYLQYHRLGDMAMTFPTFVKMVYWFLKHDIENVINLQPIAYPAIIAAAHTTNFINTVLRLGKKPIKVFLVMTELPSPRTHNFYNCVRRMNARDRKICTFITTEAPLLDREGQTEEEFWKRYTGLSLENGEVRYDAPPIREAFLAQQEKNRGGEKIDQLQVKAGSEEIELIKKSTGNLSLTAQKTERGFFLKFSAKEQEKIFAMMLGSQASKQATLDYVQNMIQWAKTCEVSEQMRLFVFCGQHKIGSQSLMKQVADFVERERQKDDYPTNFSVIPLPFQSDEEIAPMLARANATITRSGGITAMELKTVAQGQIFIHTIEEKKDKNQNKPLEQIVQEGRGMPYWEGGNYQYLKTRYGAQLISPRWTAKMFKQIPGN